MTKPSDEAVEAGARAICDQGLRALDGSPATWERHADGMRDMARDVLVAAYAADRMVPLAEVVEALKERGCPVLFLERRFGGGER